MPSSMAADSATCSPLEVGSVDAGKSKVIAAIFTRGYGALHIECSSFQLMHIATNLNSMAAKKATACDILLQKLKDNQRELQKSFRTIKESSTPVKSKLKENVSSKSGRRLAVHAHVDDLPRKRARLDQLTPENMVR